MAKKKQQPGRYEWAMLTSSEKLRLSGLGGLPHPHSRHLRTMEAVKAAWFQNRELMMTMKVPGERRTPPWGYEPGRRPWGFWVCECNLPDTPEDEVAELRKRGLLSHRERILLQEKATEDAEWASANVPDDPDEDEDGPEDVP